MTSSQNSLDLIDDLVDELGINKAKNKKFLPTKRVSVPKNKRPKYQDYTSLCNDLTKLISENNCAPIMVRLAWHDAGTYCKKTRTGGPRACMRFHKGESTYGCNGGLDVARKLLQPIVDKYTSLNFGIADIWALAGVIAIKVTGGPEVPFRLGRTDASNARESVPDGRLPDGDKGLKHLRKIFYRMGFNDKEIVILSGAHTLGRCNPNRSGFEGPWTSDPLKFDNSYYKDLVTKKWVNSLSSKDQPQMCPFIVNNSSWFGPTEDNTMMLTTDYAIFNELDTRKYVLDYAKDEQLFFKDFAITFQRLLELGYTDMELYSPGDLKSDFF